METVVSLRPSLHRFCARMTGSVMDGEDVAQEALFHAYRKLHTFDESRPLKPWLFQIAHHRCVDFLRRRGVRQEAEASLLTADGSHAEEPVGPLNRAVEHLVLALPPKERACVLLKDVFDYSLEEIAELVDSTLGGVKAALNRGRTKLAALPAPAANAAPVEPELARILELYVERFNRRDWDELRELISADARLRVADRYAGKLADSPYFGTYERWPTPWRLAVGSLQGEPVVVIHLWDGQSWKPTGVARIGLDDRQIVSVTDYLLCPWMLESA